MSDIPTDELFRLLFERMEQLRLKEAHLKAELESKQLVLAGLESSAATTVKSLTTASKRNMGADDEEEDDPQPPTKRSTQLYQSEMVEQDDDDMDGDTFDLFTMECLEGGPGDAIRRAKEMYGFDLPAAVKPRLDSDPLAMARTVNFIRSQVAKSISPANIVEQILSNANEWQSNDEYLKPFLGPNDSLLWWGDDFSEAEDGEDEEEIEDDDDDEEEDAIVVHHAKDGHEDKSLYYFDSYGKIDIHEEMLRDEARTNAYKDAFAQSNQRVMKGKTVMDIGSGTGILSMLAIRSGLASKVISVEGSRNVALLSSKLIRANGLHKQIELWNGRCEDLVESAETKGVKVDIIISEWMGYALLYESMLESVLLARDTFLKPGGRMYPNRARIFVEAITDDDGRLSFWDDVYGFNFSLARPLRTNEVDVMHVSSKAAVSDRILLKDFDLERMQEGDIDFVAPFNLLLKPGTRTDGLCVSFDCLFPTDDESKPVVLPTTPSDTPTHWKQAVLWFATPFETPADKADARMVGTLSFARRKGGNRRELDLCLRMTEPAELLEIFGLS